MSQGWEIDNYLEINGNQLHVNGVSAVNLAEKYGTPLFVFSENRIKENISRLKQAEKLIECPLKICYAAKANSNMAILRVVKEAGADLEVNSGGELWKALKIGFKPEQIIFNGTSKTVEELEAAINAGIYAIQVDSLYELDLIEETAKRLNKKAGVSLRLVPEIETETLHGLQTALLTSKFGMMPEEALTAFQKYKNSELLDLHGIHLHIGSQTPNPAHYTKALLALFENLNMIYEKTGTELRHLNLGGGFPVNYMRDEAQKTDLAAHQQELFSADFAPDKALGKAWQAVKNAARETGTAHLLKNIQILIEPGRSVIADAGICLTAVQNKKKRPINNSESELNQQFINNENRKGEHGGITFGFYNLDVWLLTDTGFNLLLSMETYKWYYHLISASRTGEKHDFPYKVAGPLCDGGDVYFDVEGHHRLPDYRLLPEKIQPGEILALLNCGAYSIAQMFQYNGRLLPAVVLISEGGSEKLIRRRDEFADLINNDVF